MVYTTKRTQCYADTKHVMRSRRVEISLHVVTLCSTGFPPPGRTLRKARRLEGIVFKFAERRQTKPAADVLGRESASYERGRPLMMLVDDGCFARCAMTGSEPSKVQDDRRQDEIHYTVRLERHSWGAQLGSRAAETHEN